MRLLGSDTWPCGSPTLWPGSVIPLAPLRPLAAFNVEIKGEWVV